MKFCVDTDSTTHAKFAAYARNVWGLVEGKEEELARQAIAKTYSFFENELEIPMKLSDVGIPTQELVRVMSEQAVLHGKLGGNVFVPLTVEDVETIVRDSFIPMEKF